MLDACFILNAKWTSEVHFSFCATTDRFTFAICPCSLVLPCLTFRGICQRSRDICQQSRVHLARISVRVLGVRRLKVALFGVRSH